MPSSRRPAVIAALLLAAATPALADPAAEQLFQDGRQLLRDGHLDEACDRFDRSQAIEPKVGTLLNLGDCRERQGRLATAWDVFLQAKALASRQNDNRAAEAARRADALAPRRAFITFVIPVARQVPGLVITRNDVEVPRSLWNVAVPIDPGTFSIVARAPGYQPQTTKVEVAGEGKATAEIAALTALPKQPVGPLIDDASGLGGDRFSDRHERGLPATGVWPPLKTLGVGGLVGLSSDNDLIGGGRLVGGIPLSGGALRGSLSVKYTREPEDPDDPYDDTDLLAFGAGLDYLWMFHRGLATGGGMGAGIDRRTRFDNPATTDTWISLRASPLILRLDHPRLELSLQLEFVLPQRILLTLVGVDWFVW